MYRGLEDFHRSYTQLTAGTARLLDVLTNEALTQRVASEHRTLGHVAWHIVVTVPEMMAQTGLPLSRIDHEAPPPDQADVIADAYRAVSGELTQAVADKWTDADLVVTDTLYGESWPRGLTLAILIHHEIHHRGQLTVLMRQAGLTVPGLYGPAKEEWGQYGKEAPPY